jgi:hypothetical protein
MAEATTSPPNQSNVALAGGQQRIGEITVEVADENNRNLLFGPTQVRLRGRWDWANLARGETSEVGLTKMPVVPGMYLSVNVRQHQARVDDPLGFPANRALLTTVNAVHMALWNFGTGPVDPVVYEGLTDDQLATWLYWIWRGLSAKHMRLIAGQAYTLEDLATQFPRAKIRRQFFDSLAYNKQGNGQTAKDVAREVAGND